MMRQDKDNTLIDQGVTITHDTKFDIAVGKSRWEKNWKNIEMEWSFFISKISKPLRTHETYREYLDAGKSRQDEIKDAGGYIGGRLTGNRRKAGSVLHRQLITLDIDFATRDFWDDFQLAYTCAAALHSTHKHSSNSPRLRLIIPLDRPVKSAEYEAIARKIAGILDIELFDPTTFQPERLMYWPTVSKDGEYVFEYQDGAFLSADKILSLYNDWTDSSEWPVSSKVAKVIQRGMVKQGDPLEKTGIVGTFCRCYSISEVIGKYLPDVYEPCSIKDRYTYKNGSTAAGMITYDDKFAYSHHGTDPTSGKLCNAFDLVRLHKYGPMDDNIRENTAAVKMPSYMATTQMLQEDLDFKKFAIKERIQQSNYDFKDVHLESDESGEDEDLLGERPTEQPESDDWLKLFKVDRNGSVIPSRDNIKTILDNDPKLKGCIGYDSFRHREVLLRNPPWRKITQNSRIWTDLDDAGLRHYLETTHGISSDQKIRDSFSLAIRDQSFHPVINYLNDTTWDGQHRLESLFIDYMGAENSDYVRAVTRKTFVAAVARIFNPGVKFDYVLVLVGNQGMGKSSLVGKLGQEWFSDSFSFNMIHTKEAYEQIQGVWLIEIAELTGLKRSDVEAVKQFISKREDSFRVAYGRRTESFPRQCIFIGTTNSREFLIDPTGNRRFWPIDLMAGKPSKDIFRDFNAKEISQVWAEAVCLYKAGETLFLNAELEEEAFNKQEAHSERDDRHGSIQKYLDTLLPVRWDEMNIFERRAYLQGDELAEIGTVKRERVCISEIWLEALGHQQKDMNRYNTKPIHNIMRSMEGWVEHNSKFRTKLYGIQRGYIRAKK